MKPSDTNSRTLGLLGLLYNYKRKNKEYLHPDLLPYSLSRSLATFSDPATFCALQRWAENDRIVARAFLKDGGWSTTTDPDFRNILNSQNKRTEMNTENRNLSVKSRSEAFDFLDRRRQMAPQAPSKATISETDIRLWHSPGFYLVDGNRHDENQKNQAGEAPTGKALHHR